MLTAAKTAVKPAAKTALLVKVFKQFGKVMLIFKK